MIKDPFPTSGILFYKDVSVCVTGATGLIGSYVVKLLKESGAYVVAIVNNRPDNEFTKYADEIHPGDLTNPTIARACVQGAEIVVGCAGITGGVGIVKVSPVSYVGPATVMACNTLHACFEEGIVRNYGFLSSTTVYPPSDMPVKESELDYGKPPYKMYEGISESKRFLEKLCLYYHERVGTNVAIIRPSGAYGRFDNFDESTSHVIPGMINRALREKEIFEVWGDGGDTRDFIHAQDVAYGFLLAIAKTRNADPINIASGVGVTTMDLAKTILKVAESKAQIVTNPSKPSALRTRLVDITKARELLGFEPKISLEDGLRDTINYLRSK